MARAISQGLVSCKIWERMPVAGFDEDFADFYSAPSPVAGGVGASSSVLCWGRWPG
jgi:hypothetical protein